MMIDTHCHLDMMPNPEAFIRQREQAGDIVIGMTNLPSHFKMGMPFVRGLKNIRLAIGLHPLRVAENKGEIHLFKRLIDETFYIGEIGLDFSREGFYTKETQIAAFREILSALTGKKKIISVHSRRAERQVLQLLCENKIENVIFHWYSGPIGLVKQILDCGYYFSVNEAMTLSENGRMIINKLPRDRILTESDAPYNGVCDIKNVLHSLNISCDDVLANFNCLKSKIT